MKSMNIFQFVSNASEELTRYEIGMKDAETYDRVKKIGNRMIGYIDCMITVSNTMICMENNEITAMLDDVETEWLRKTFQAMIDRAVELKCDEDIIWKLCEKRDEYR